MTVPVGASAISDEAENLLRQVHPTQIKNDGVPDSSAFCPSPRDEGKLSTRRERIGPKRAHVEWVAAGRASAGTWGVQPGDFPEGISAYDDSHVEGVPDGHASVDFGELGRGARQRAGRVLRQASHARGCMFPSPAA